VTSLWDEDDEAGDLTSVTSLWDEDDEAELEFPEVEEKNAEHVISDCDEEDEAEQFPEVEKEKEEITEDLTSVWDDEEAYEDATDLGQV